MKIYLSHYPKDESKARKFAKELMDLGYEVVIAADVRPHKIMPRNEKDEEIVRKAMKSCDSVLVLF